MSPLGRKHLVLEHRDARLQLFDVALHRSDAGGNCRDLLGKHVEVLAETLVKALHVRFCVGFRFVEARFDACELRLRFREARFCFVPKCFDGICKPLDTRSKHLNVSSHGEERSIPFFAKSLRIWSRIASKLC